MEVDVIGYLVLLVPALKGGLMILGALVVSAQAVVALTPSKKDDKAIEGAKKIPFLGAILKGLEALAPIKKK